MNVQRVETELHKRLAYPYQWHGRQTDSVDRATNFVYRCESFDTLTAHLRTTTPDVRDYALNRWYNFWSAQAIQEAFCAHPIVRPEPNTRHQSIDFYVQGIPFDHKSTVFPAGFPGGIHAALRYPRALIDWLYANQSTGRRHHNSNRLFIVLYDDDGQHWKLKAEVSSIACGIHRYLDEFDPHQLHQLENGAKADVIWYME